MPTAAESTRPPPADPMTARDRPRGRWLFAAIFFGLAALITLTNRESFFGTPLHEEGDIAANALQVERAKAFRELRGNYSRWGFHHPGPAFFYVYAAGDGLLHGLTRIAPAPYNAQGYAGVLLQLAFYAAAVTLLARHTRRPLLAATLAVAAGALHFAHVDRALYSIWPPDVLLMPLLCFVVACAAASVGDRAALPVLALAGGFLVHGHIAQPLFVLPMSALVGWLLGRDALRAAVRSRAGVVALAVLAVFVLPLGLDLFQGRDSNAYSVWLHVRHQSDAGQTLWQSVLLYASFFIGVPNPEIFNELTAESYAPFRARAWWMLGWAVALGLTWWSFRAPRISTTTRVEPSCPRRFGRRLLLFWAVASVLTLVWGMRQDGGFTFFNSSFNHALVHVVVFAVLLALTNAAPPVSRGFGWSLVAVTLFVFTLALPLPLRPGSRGDELAVRLPALLQADPKPAAPKLITFAPADWFEAVTLGRALQRRGIAFYVHPNFRILFGPDKILLRGDWLSRGEMSVWHVVGRRAAPPDAQVLNREAAVVFAAASVLPPLPTAIDFSTNEHQRYPVFGLGAAFEGWVWAEGRVAAIMFEAAPAERDIALTLTASGIVNAARPRGQRLTLLMNGEPLDEQRFDDTTRTASWIIPAAAWNRQRPRTLVFETPDAIAPAMTGRSADRRLLSLRLHRLTFAPARERP